MSRFYCFTYDYIMGMDSDIFSTYVIGMNEIQNEELLEGFTKQSYTKLGKEDRNKLHRNTYKCAFPNVFSEKKNAVKLSQLGKVLNNG